MGIPGMDGWGVCRQVKALAPQTVVILVTGWRIDPEALQAGGVDLILHKPFTIHDVSSTMNRAEALLG